MVSAKPSSPTIQTGHDLYTNLVCCLPFSEGSGSAGDVSAESNDASLGTGVTWDSTTEGDFVACDGTTNGVLTITADTSLDSAEVTCAIWVRTTDTWAYGARVVHKGNDDYFLGFNSDGGGNNDSIQATCYAGGWLSAYSDEAVDPADGSWHLWVFRYDKSSQDVFLDGDKFTGSSGSADIDTSSLALYLGGNPASADGCIDGDILSFMQWDTGLSDSQIGTLYTDPWGLIDPGGGGGSGGGALAAIKNLFKRRQRLRM